MIPELVNDNRLLNERSELIAKCNHSNRFYLSPPFAELILFSYFILLLLFFLLFLIWLSKLFLLVSTRLLWPLEPPTLFTFFLPIQVINFCVYFFFQCTCVIGILLVVGFFSVLYSLFSKTSENCSLHETLSWQGSIFRYFWIIFLF